jgi:hypothetical protein
MRQRLIHGSTMMMLSAGIFLAALPSAARQGGSDRAALVKEAAAKPTPRMKDGHPDLSGNWSNPPVPLAPANFVNLPVVRSADGKTLTVLDRDAPELDALDQPRFKARVADQSRRPPYKKQFVAKQRELMYTASRIDPGIHCYPKGVPRLGAPTEIVSAPAAVYFFYAGEHTHRIIPIGGKHDPDRDPLPDGDSIAYWDGDTLVVDVVNFDPETWLDGDGDFHDDNLHVVERFTRKGNTLEYDVTIEDPTLFTGPWKPISGQYRPGDGIGSKTMLLREADVHDLPDYACLERDREHQVNNDRF